MRDDLPAHDGAYADARAGSSNVGFPATAAERAGRRFDADAAGGDYERAVDSRTKPSAEHAGAKRSA